MAELLLLGNPRRRRKMTAKQAKYFGKRRRRSTKSHRKVAVRSNPHRRTHKVRRRRHNPSMRASFGSLKNSVVPTLKAGLIGAGGAIGLDLAWGYGKQYLPASIATSPIAQYAVKLAIALGVGIVGNKLLKGKGTAMAIGATTVVLHDAIKAQIQASFPSIQLGEYLTSAPTVGVIGPRPRMLSTGMGQYLSGYGDSNGEYCGDNADGGYGQY